MSQLAKALFAKCPKCGSTSVQLVESYKKSLRTSKLRSFECDKCGTEYFARKQEIVCGVAKVPDTSPSLSA